MKEKRKVKIWHCIYPLKLCSVKSKSVYRFGFAFLLPITKGGLYRININWVESEKKRRNTHIYFSPQWDLKLLWQTCAKTFPFKTRCTFLVSLAFTRFPITTNVYFSLLCTYFLAKGVFLLYVLRIYRVNVNLCGFGKE